MANPWNQEFIGQDSRWVSTREELTDFIQHIREGIESEGWRLVNGVITELHLKDIREQLDAANGTVGLAGDGERSH